MCHDNGIKSHQLYKVNTGKTKINRDVCNYACTHLLTKRSNSDDDRAYCYLVIMLSRKCNIFSNNDCQFQHLLVNNNFK